MDIYAVLREPKLDFVLVSPAQSVGIGAADLKSLGAEAIGLVGEWAGSRARGYLELNLVRSDWKRPKVPTGHGLDGLLSRYLAALESSPETGFEITFNGNGKTATSAWLFLGLHTESDSTRQVVVAASVQRESDHERGRHASDDAELVAGLARAGVSHLGAVHCGASFGSVGYSALRITMSRKETVAALEADVVRGYDWLQVLTPAMVERLRSEGRDMDAVAAEVVESVRGPEGSTYMVCRVRRSPYECDENAQRKFRSFVLPILVKSGAPSPDSPVAMNGVTRPPEILPEDWWPSSTPT